MPRPASGWSVAGLRAAAASLWLPVGGWATLLAVPWLLACTVLAVAGLCRARRARPAGVATASVGARDARSSAPLALVAERAGWGLLGYSGDYLTLTVPHMLFAGFGACLVAGLGVEDGRAAPVGRGDGAVGVLLVLVGYFVGDAAELVGALVLTVGLYGVALATLGAPARPGAPRRAAHARRRDVCWPRWCSRSGGRSARRPASRTPGSRAWS